METFTHELLAQLGADSGHLLGVAKRVLAVTPGMGSDLYSDAELGQLLNGFKALLTEGLEETGSEVFDFFVDTAVPGLVADGQSAATLSQAAATFSVFCALWLAEGLSAPNREDGQVWLAGFLGRYVRAVAESARHAEERAR